MKNSKKSPRRLPEGGARSRTHKAHSAGTLSSPALRELWLAGLGTALMAGEAADGLVATLVAKGRQREPRVRAQARRAIGELQKVGDRAIGELQGAARGAIEGVLQRLGLPENRRQKNLLHRLGDLAEAIL